MPKIVQGSEAFYVSFCWMVWIIQGNLVHFIARAFYAETFRWKCESSALFGYARKQPLAYVAPYVHHGPTILHNRITSHN